MKKNNGFTLFEMIIVIGISAGFLSIFLVNFSGEIKRINQKQTENMKKQVIDAAETYVALNRNSDDEKYSDIKDAIIKKTCATIYISTLESDGYIAKNVLSTSFKNKYAFVSLKYNNSKEIYEYRFDVNC